MVGVLCATDLQQTIANSIMIEMNRRPKARPAIVGVSIDSFQPGMSFTAAIELAVRHSCIDSIE